jgi:hypothetical protein
MKLLRILVVLAVLAGGASLALAAPRVSVTPLPGPQPIALQRSVITLQSVAADCGPIYSNTQNLLGYFYAGGAGVEVADDLHMTMDAHLCGIDFGYYKSTAGTTAATIVFYANDQLDNLVPSVVLAGPYVVTDLPTGANVIHVDLGSGTGMPDVTQDVWLGISFSTASTGLLMTDPPELGISDDLFYKTPPGQYAWFGGDPVANFYLAVYGNELATPAAATTWGRVKQLYR